MLGRWLSRLPAPPDSGFAHILFLHARGLGCNSDSNSCFLFLLYFDALRKLGAGLEHSMLKSLPICKNEGNPGLLSVALSSCVLLLDSAPFRRVYYFLILRSS